jgi:uncharacterized damage-inducible protein DinB
MSDTPRDRTILLELFRHHLWANQTLLDTCASQPDAVLDAAGEAAYGTPRATLVHILAAEERYLELLDVPAPDPPLRESDPFPGFDLLRARAARSGEALIEAAARLDPAGTWTSDWQDQTYTSRKLVALLQAINHGTEHREQIKHALTVAGIEPPEIDGWAYSFTAGLIRPIED